MAAGATTYIVEMTDSNGCGYEGYDGSDLSKAEEFYNHYASKNTFMKVELYQKLIISCTTNNKG